MLVETLTLNDFLLGTYAMIRTAFLSGFFFLFFSVRSFLTVIVLSPKICNNNKKSAQNQQSLFLFEQKFQTNEIFTSQKRIFSAIFRSTSN